MWKKKADGEKEMKNQLRFSGTTIKNADDHLQ